MVARLMILSIGILGLALCYTGSANLRAGIGTLQPLGFSPYRTLPEFVPIYFQLLVEGYVAQNFQN
jgi:hypothetical protein